MREEMGTGLTQDSQAGQGGSTMWPISSCSLNVGGVHNTGRLCWASSAKELGFPSLSTVWAGMRSNIVEAMPCDGAG